MRFNSNTDWGFRIGNWYFIHKSMADRSSDEQRDSPRISKDRESGREGEMGTKDNREFPLVTPASPDGSENGSMVNITISKKREDNEIEDGVKKDQSAEVLESM